MATGPQGPLQLQLLAKRALALGAGRLADGPWARSRLLVIRELSRKLRRDLRRRPAQRELGGHACAKAPARVQLAHLGTGRIALGPHLRRIGVVGPIAPPVARGLPARGRAREPDAARDLLVGAARCKAARDGGPLREAEPCGPRACTVPLRHDGAPSASDEKGDPLRRAPSPHGLAARLEKALDLKKGCPLPCQLHSLISGLAVVFHLRPPSIIRWCDDRLRPPRPNCTPVARPCHDPQAP